MRGIMCKLALSLTDFSHMCVCRCEELEKEVAILKEKIHHLDDMLKSQQRKVRHMIEQVRMHTSMLNRSIRCTQTRTHKASELSGAHKCTGSC